MAVRSAWVETPGSVVTGVLEVGTREERKGEGELIQKGFFR